MIMTSAIDAVLVPLNLYALGHATGDASHFREAFLPTAHIEGMRDGQFSSWDLSTYCARFEGVPAVNEDRCVRTVDHLQVQARSPPPRRHPLDDGASAVTSTTCFLLVFGRGDGGS